MNPLPDTAVHECEANALLARLPPELLMRLAAHLEYVNLPAGAVVASAGQPVRQVYFPLCSVISVVHEDADGSTTQVALVGREGMLGVVGFLGGVHRAGSFVIAAGRAARLPVRTLLEFFDAERAFRDALLCYTADILAAAWQIALCNRHHMPERQLSTLLMMVFERSGRPEATMTHDLMARLLGVRRETVTQSAMRLQERGYVRYTRGHIRLLDRNGLAGMACPCLHRLLPLT